MLQSSSSSKLLWLCVYSLLYTKQECWARKVIFPIKPSEWMNKNGIDKNALFLQDTEKDPSLKCKLSIPTSNQSVSLYDKHTIWTGPQNPGRSEIHWICLTPLWPFKSFPSPNVLKAECPGLLEAFELVTWMSPWQQVCVSAIATTSWEPVWSNLKDQ